MKTTISILALFFSVLIFSQKSDNSRTSTSFTQKILRKKGVQLVLKKIINDSRCPEGVNCIWAGECEIQVAIYKDRKLISTENILLSPKLYKENIAWFSKYYPNKKIKEINLLPYPKNDVTINPKDFFVQILLE